MFKRLLLTLASLVLTLAPAAAAYNTETLGGQGGEHYYLTCNSGLLVGLRFGLGDNVDHVSLICSGDRDLVDYYDQEGQAGRSGGGDARVLKCTPGSAVKTIYASTYNNMVGVLGLGCKDIHTGSLTTEQVNWDPGGGTFTSSPVPAECKPHYWAQGIQGNAGDLVDSIGLVCAKPQIADEQPSPPAPPAPGDQSGTWSAFSSNGQGNWGYAAHRASEGLATGLAMEGCGGAGAGCKVFWTTEDSCVAYAESRSGGYWYAAGGGQSLDEAAGNALRFCQSGTAPANSCRIAFSGCR